MTALAQSVPRPRTIAFDAALVVLGSLVVAGLAQVSIHFRFVPITGQTLGVLLVAAALGAARGAAAIALYLAEGTVGLPVFAEGRSGVEFLLLRDPLHVTGGYLWGFVLAAAVVGVLAERGWDRRPGSALGAMFLGNVSIYLVGLPWLAASLGIPVVDPAASPCDLATASGCDALELGLYPFVVGDTVKLLLAAGALPAVWRLTRRRR
ncbi:MAG TPA: biotin transporter BioY [Actinomycetota bacterium]|jgi:biotin transport system substrate-specific component|nr:biotin transporter BioY [Actinomycetota bacterium]